MRQIRFLGALLACIVLFAGTGFGQTLERTQIPERTLKISNRSVYTAYCAYSYVVKDAENDVYREKTGYHVKGWVIVPSGRAEYIQYRSKFPAFVYFILDNGKEKTEYSEDENLYPSSVHYVPARLWNAIRAGRKPIENQFEIVQTLNTGAITSISGADQSDLEQVTFYSRKNVPIPGTVEIVEPQEMEEFDVFYDRSGFVRTGTDYALLFATNDYFRLDGNNEKKAGYWKDLSTPISDAKILGEELKKYGFKVDIRENLETRADILKAIGYYADKDYKTGDQLFVYFAGHGHFHPGFQGGYIAAGDSKAPDDDPGMASYLNYDELKGHLDRIDCDRVMLALDVCYGGAFDDSFTLPIAPPTRGSDDGPAVRGVARLRSLDKTLKVKTRWYLSSGGREVVVDGLPGSNSPFVLTLVSLLRNGAGEDGVLTIPEIERQLRVTLEAELDEFEADYKKKEPLWDGELQQNPVSGPFESEKQKAFVFIKK